MPLVARIAVVRRGLRRLSVSRDIGPY
jgi:hypothetical protein